MSRHLCSLLTITGAPISNCAEKYSRQAGIIDPESGKEEYIQPHATNSSLHMLRSVRRSKTSNVEQ